LDAAARPGGGVLDCLGADLSVARKLDGLTIPNGLAWSADAATMYYIDSPSGAVWAYAWDRETGGLGERRIAVRIESPASPDGMTIDEEGMLWVAEWGIGSVSRFDPATGERLARVRLPVLQATSCTFGGEDLGDLYVTTGREHFTAEDAARQPLAGGLFRARPGVRGLPPARFRG
jgi:sugar lactone lactonase YvrE